MNEEDSSVPIPEVVVAPRTRRRTSLEIFAASLGLDPKAVLIRAIQTSRSNREAAYRLGVSVAALYRYIHQYDLRIRYGKIPEE